MFQCVLIMLIMGPAGHGGLTEHIDTKNSLGSQLKFESITSGKTRSRFEYIAKKLVFLTYFSSLKKSKLLD